MQWPPNYIASSHPLAKSVKLKINYKEGLKIITPPKFNLKKIPSILEKHKDWLIKKLSAISVPFSLSDFPQEINLLATNQIWKIFYCKSNDNKIQCISRPSSELVLIGKIDDSFECKKIIINWAKEQAKFYLSSQLEYWSKKTNLSYKKFFLKNQKSCWGSCSRKGSICLNYKLIFFPSSVVTYVIIHELCHLLHLNHSTNFWQLVESFEPRWKEHRKNLRKLASCLPDWIP